MTNYMLDLETMGTDPSAAIVAIGACVFQPMEMRITDTFYTTISLGSAMQNGGLVNASTVVWWLRQGEDARTEVYSATTHIYSALTAFTAWLERNEPNKDKRLIWGNGANFDNVLLRTAYERLKMHPPWHFRSDRCYRTFVKELGSQVPKPSFEGVRHNALDDARWQAEYLMEVMRARR